MSPAVARWFALGTGVLALLSVAVAVWMGLRLHQTRTDLAHLRHDDSCPAARTP